ncbi:hypothetical protein WDU94_000446 [Cyamophila willieti]
MNFGSKEFLSQLTSNTPLKSSIQSAQSNQDRLNIVFQHLVEKERGFLEFIRNVSQRHGKDYQRSLSAKNAANVEFGAKRCHSALLKTNEGLSVAPPGSDLLAILYGNRSAILFDLEQYKDCILNIELALNEKCPKSLKPKLLFRKAKGLKLLKESELAEKAYEASLRKIEAILCSEVSEVERKQYEELEKKMEKSWKDLCQEKCFHERPSENKNEPEDKRALQKRISKNIDNASTTLGLVNINPDIPVASSSVTLSHSDTFGRSVTAVEDISPGNIVIIEQPTVSVLRPENLFRLTHCHACLLRCVNCAIPCDSCDVLYCGDDCKVRSSESYHRSECWTLQRAKQMDMFGIVEMLALRFVLQETKQGQNIEALWRKTPHAVASPNVNGTSQFDLLTNEVSRDLPSGNEVSRDIPSENEVLRDVPSGTEVLRDFPSLVYHLETNEAGRDPSDRITRAVKAVILCELLKIDGVFQNNHRSAAISNATSSGCNGVAELPASDRIDDVTRLNLSDKSDCDDVTRLSPFDLQFASLLVHYFQAVACNAHDINTFFASPSAGGDQVHIGSGLYPFCSMVNHSCDPNVVRHSQGTTIIMTALKGIPAGQQLFDNYGVHYATHEKVYRQSYLLSQYRFNCACAACENNFPLFTPAVGGEASLMFREGITVSTACEREILKSGELFNEVLVEMVESNGRVGNVEEKLSVVNRYMRLLNEFVRGPRQEFEKCQETYKRLVCYLTNCVMLEQGEEFPEVTHT